MTSTPSPSSPATESALLPCPFCGGCDTKIDMKPPYGVKSVYCRNAACEASGPWAPTKAQAIAAWNRRPPVSSPADSSIRSEALEEAKKVAVRHITTRPSNDFDSGISYAAEQIAFEINELKEGK